MIILTVIGLVVAVWVGNRWGLVPGLIVGFLLVGGFGWKLIGGALNLVWVGVHPGAKKHTDAFWNAWEVRHGPVVRGVPSTYPPQGLFQAWHKEYKRSGMEPGPFLDRL